MRKHLISVYIILLSSLGVLKAQWVKTEISNYKATPVAINATAHIYALYNAYGEHQFKRSSDDGATWQDMYNHNFDSITNGGSILTVTENDRYLIAEIINGSDYSGIYRSTDSGDSWRRTDGAGFAISSIGKFYYFDSLLIGIEEYGGLLLSTDNGNNWKIILNTSVYPETADITGVIMDGGELYVTVIRSISNYPRPPLKTGFMLRSSNNGNTWDTVENTISKIPITALAENNGMFYADAGLLYRSQNMEGIWKSITYDVLVPGIQFLSFSGENVFAGLVVDTFAIGTIFWSSNNGDSWYDFTGNLQGHSIYNLFVHGKYVFSGTEHDIWRRPLSDFSTVIEKSNVSSPNLSLSPNPTSCIGNIIYSLGNATHVRIEIYNAIGQLIQKVCDDFESEGSHTKKFDLSHFPSGEYFFRMQSEGVSEVRVLQLLR